MRRVLFLKKENLKPPTNPLRLIMTTNVRVSGLTESSGPARGSETAAAGQGWWLDVASPSWDDMRSIGQVSMRRTSFVHKAHHR